MTSTTGQLIINALNALSNADKANIQKAWDAIGTVLDNLLDNLIAPSGSIQMYGNATPPSGWLICDGSAVSRSTYLGLFSAIGITFGSGDGVNTFNLPDFGGIFPRGAGTNGTLSNANAVAFAGILGAYQNDKFQGHRHKLRYTGFFQGNPSPPYGGGDSPASEVHDPSTDGTNGTPRTGVETNPANLSVYFIIKV